MKDVIKIIAIIVTGLFTAIFIYPFLHEGGHSLASVIVGAKVEEFNLYPLPNVLCNMQSVGTMGEVIIGISGMLFPFLLTSLIQPKKFWSWYICFITRGICLLSFVIAFFAVLVFETNLKMINEDITQVMQLTSYCGELYVIALLVFITWDILLVVKSHPIRRCIEFFNLEKKNASEA